MVDDSNNEKIIIAYQAEDPYYGKAIVGTVSGMSISFGTAATFNSSLSDYITIAYDANAQKVVIAYRDASVHPVGEHKKIDDGVIKIVRSFDGGSTWEKTFIAWLDKDWDCAGSRTLIVTPIGLIMFVFKAKRANLKSPISTIQTILSTDNGYNWKLLSSTSTKRPEEFEYLNYTVCCIKIQGH